MPDCPSYRIRIFLSVDLVGSTEFKNLAETREQRGIIPRWAVQIKRFYQTFPDLFHENFGAAAKGIVLDECETPPAIWKTIGDEIVFCGRVYSLEHFSICVSAFVSALERYGLLLEADGLNLDVKGAIWVAGFPAPNITVKVFSFQRFRKLRKQTCRLRKTRGWRIPPLANSISLDGISMRVSG